MTVPGPGAMNADNTAVADVSKLETREVTLGKSDGDFSEVTGGLEEGDTVDVYKRQGLLRRGLSAGRRV